MKISVPLAALITFISLNGHAQDQARFSESVNAVGFRLFKENLKLDHKNKDTKNTLVSPYSAHVVLSMVANGTARDTRSEMLKALALPGDFDVLGLARSHGDLSSELSLKPLSDSQKERRAKSFQPIPYGFISANGAWHTNGATDGRKYAFNDRFKDLLGRDFSAEVQALDFKKKSSADAINSFVDKNTLGLIPKIIDTDTLKELVWVLVNATYFEGRWTREFSLSEANKPDSETEFTGLAGQKTYVDMIGRRGSFKHLKNSQVEVVELDIEESPVVFLLALPSSTKSFERSAFGDASDDLLAPDRWQEWADELTTSEPKNGILKFPKFSFEYGFQLLKNQDLTRAVGLNFAFQDTADFSSMDTEGLIESVLGIVKQKSKIVLDEKGIKAAAVTLAGGVGRTAQPRPEFDLLVNRPFYFSIYDTKSRTFLFLGSVVQP